MEVEETTVRDRACVSLADILEKLDAGKAPKTGDRVVKLVSNWLIRVAKLRVRRSARPRRCALRS